MIVEFAIMLLTFVMKIFCSKMLATRSLMQIDMVKEMMLNCEL